MVKELYYYQNSMMKEFTSEVKKVGIEGERPFIVLSNTAFYPTGGGQPHDTGMIDHVRVIDVEKVDNEIRHYVEGDIDSVNGTIHGVLDWGRRFDHMQQHCGQHILSAAFVELFNLATVSFHLGNELVTIDINTSNITEEQLYLVEQRANEIILENRPIETKWITKDELSNYPLRKDVSVEEDIRLVIIPDYDYNGCGGTHPTSTGQVSCIKIMDIEKMKKNIRVSFVCGGRVLSQLGMRKAVLSNVARQLSVPEEASADALRKVLSESKATEKALEDAQYTLLEFEAKEVIKECENGIVALVFKNRSIQSLQKLSRAIIALHSEVICLLVANNGDKLQFVAARGSSSNKNMKDLANQVLPLINGKGGGNDSFVQGGGEKILSAEELLKQMQLFLK